MGAIKNKGRQLHQIERVPYEDAFLIGDLLTTRITVLSGHTLLVTHTPKGSAEGMTVASSPIGGRAIAAGARAVIALRNSGKQGRRIQTAINRAAEDLDLRVAVRRASESSEVPIWERSEAGLKAARPTEPTTWVEDLFTRIIQEQPEETSYKALAERYAPLVERKAETIRPKLRDGVAYVADRWARKPTGN